MRQLQTVKDLAQSFQKHENTIYRWITEDRLFPNAFKVKDGWYVPESDVRRVMRDGRRVTTRVRSCVVPIGERDYPLKRD